MPAHQMSIERGLRQSNPERDDNSWDSETTQFKGSSDEFMPSGHAFGEVELKYGAAIGLPSSAGRLVSAGAEAVGG